MIHACVDMHHKRKNITPAGLPSVEVSVAISKDTATDVNRIADESYLVEEII